MSTRLTVATWNLWGANWPEAYVRQRQTWRGAVPGSPAGLNRDRANVLRSRRQLMLGALADMAPDVVAIQEDDGGDHGRHSTFLADRLDRYEAAAHTASDLAILTRSGLAVGAPTDLGHSSAAGRPALALDLVTPTTRIRLINAHLPLDAGARRAVLTELVAAATEITETTLLCGDLNVATTDGTLESLAAAGFIDLGPDLGPTAPSEAPVVRLDYVLCRAEPRTRTVSTVASGHLGWQPDAAGHYASDHLGVVVLIDIE